MFLLDIFISFRYSNLILYHLNPTYLDDVCLSFRTTFVSKEGEAIYDPMIIAKNYLRGWFVIDAFSAMPYDLLLFGSGNVDVNIFSPNLYIFIYYNKNLINNSNRKLFLCVNKRVNLYRNFKYIPTIKDKDVCLINQIFDYFYICLYKLCRRNKTNQYLSVKGPES